MGNGVGKGLVAGLIGGAVGTAALTLFQTGSLEATRAVEPGWRKRYTREQEGLAQQFQRAHTLAAETAAGTVGRRLTRGQKKAAPLVTEFAFGMVCAGVYGALAEVVPGVTAGFGSVFGAVLFAGASEAVLPALGWVPQPKDRTAVQHAGGLAGNVVYGVVTEAVRRGVLAAL